ncbi:hypothetical protein Ciccas_000888 [Cichlidogyrus casuarinus]|uniref:Uncharacterized protein n=1 Tax=Cichlidogyrus casuarinus TaxID=1844966 RepID=A0ABD2QLM9_9PLAT
MKDTKYILSVAYPKYFIESSFSTVLYNKKTKRLSVIHSKAEFLIPVFTTSNEESPEMTPIVPKASDTFGSARLQKALREREKHAISSEVGKDLQLMGKEIKSINRIENSQKTMAERVGSDGLVDISVVLPYFNVDTINVSDIYPISELCPDSLFEVFKKNLEDIYIAPGKGDTKQVFRTVYSRALKFAHNDSNSEASTKDKALLVYLRALMVLFTAHPKVLKTRYPFPDEDKVIGKVANMFTTFILTGNQKSKIMTPVLKQRLLNYILITLLHIDRYTTKIDDYLCQDLSLTSDQLVYYST